MIITSIDTGPPQLVEVRLGYERAMSRAADTDSKKTGPRSGLKSRKKSKNTVTTTYFHWKRKMLKKET